MTPPKVLLVGAGGREHAIGAALHRSEARLYVAAPNINPGLHRIAEGYKPLKVEDGEAITEMARNAHVALAVLGPDAAVAAGVADKLRAAGVPTVGPGAAAGRIESSKSFARNLMVKHAIPGLVRYAEASSVAELDAAASQVGEPFVVKPSWLTAGKGVWVQGADFATREEGLTYAKKLLEESGGQPVVLEEKLEGEEFSYMAFVDGSAVYPMPAVQDYKRALEGDKGGNTGGMGSYSSRDGSLPFLRSEDLSTASSILTKTVDALKQEGLEYRGILYGGFMATAKGISVLEFNARFGDPESLNVLTIFDGTDFAELLAGVAGGKVNPIHVRFRKRATVVKYLVPPGYGSNPEAGGVLKVSPHVGEDEGVTLYYGSVTPGPSKSSVVMGSSRALALVGEASALKDAHARAEEAVRHIEGSYYLRHDVGSPVDTLRRVEHMRALRGLPPKAQEPNLTRSGPAPPPVFS